MAVAHPKERQIPLVLIAVAVAVFVVAALVRAGTAGVAPTLLGLLIVASVQTVLLIVAALVVGSVLSVGFGEVPTAALKFAAITLFSSALGALIPMGWIVALFVFLGLVVWLFEVEMVYAVALAVVYVVIGWLLGFVLAGALR